MAALVGGLLLVAAGLPAAASAKDGVDGAEPVAYLDGRPIPLSDVGRYYCDDFDYPVIQCSRSPLLTDLRGSVVALFSGADYVTMYDQSAYGGVYMHVSQDYPMLLTIGWNDQVSSLKARNSETGRFTTDWLYGGNVFSFCCNSQYSSLGSWNNTFSSVNRT